MASGFEEGTGGTGIVARRTANAKRTRVSDLRLWSVLGSVYYRGILFGVVPMRMIISLAVFCCLLSPAVADDWKSKRVMPKKYLDKFLLVDQVLEERDGRLRLQNDGREAWGNKDDFVTTEDAPAYFDAIVKSDPREPYAYIMRGHCSLLTGDYGNAIRDANAAINRKIVCAAAYDLRGKAYARQREYGKAISDLSYASQLSPDSCGPFISRGFVWIEKKDHDEAIADFTEAIRLNPHALAYGGRGRAYTLKKEFEKAFADFDQALKLDPKNVLVLSNRATALSATKKYREAMSSYEAALVVDPTSEYALAQSSWLLACCPSAEVRDGKRAVEYGKKLVALNRDWWGSHSILAAAFAELDDFESAVWEQVKAIGMLKSEKNIDADDLKKAEARLELYRAKKPYRDEE